MTARDRATFRAASTRGRASGIPFSGVKQLIAVLIGAPAGAIVGLTASGLACANSIACIPVDVFLTVPLVAFLVAAWLWTRPDRTFPIQAAAAVIWLAVHAAVIHRYGPGLCEHTTAAGRDSPGAFRSGTVCTPEPYVLTLVIMSAAFVVQLAIQLVAREPGRGAAVPPDAEAVNGSNG